MKKTSLLAERDLKLKLYERADMIDLEGRNLYGEAWDRGAVPESSIAEITNKESAFIRQEAQQILHGLPLLSNSITFIINMIFHLFMHTVRKKEEKEDLWDLWNGMGDNNGGKISPPPYPDSVTSAVPNKQYGYQSMKFRSSRANKDDVTESGSTMANSKSISKEETESLLDSYKKSSKNASSPLKLDLADIRNLQNVSSPGTASQSQQRPNGWSAKASPIKHGADPEYSINIPVPNFSPHDKGGKDTYGKHSEIVFNYLKHISSWLLLLMPLLIMSLCHSTLYHRYHNDRHQPRSVLM